MGALRDQVAIVTGSSKGVGRATAVLLAREGARVVCTARTAPLLEEVAEQITRAGGTSLVAPGDASREEDVARVVGLTREAWGRVDILVNNAGIGILGPLQDARTEDFDLTMAANVRSVFLYSRAVIPGMIAQGGGSIINVASISGIKAFANVGVYCASKFAVVGLTRSMDLELREHNVKVTAICPAGIDTDWAIGTGLDRDEVAKLDRLKPETVAESILFAATQPANARVTELIVYPMREEGHQ